jgi:tetratricopeptide (TPR) repeat protein
MISQHTFADPLQSEVIQKGLKSYLRSNTNELIEMHDTLVSSKRENAQAEELDLQILFHEFLITDLSSKKQKKKFSALCISKSDMAEEANEYQAELFALLSACYGFSAESNFFKAASHGIKSGKMMEKAIEADDKNPFVYLIKGIGDYTRPAFAGASKKNAKENLIIVLNLLDENTSNRDLLMESITHFHLGNIAYLEKDNELSLEYLNKSLEFAPQYKRANDLKIKIES